MKSFTKKYTLPFTVIIMIMLILGAATWRGCNKGSSGTVPGNNTAYAPDTEPSEGTPETSAPITPGAEPGPDSEPAEASTTAPSASPEEADPAASSPSINQTSPSSLQPTNSLTSQPTKQPTTQVTTQPTKRPTTAPTTATSNHAAAYKGVTYTTPVDTLERCGFNWDGRAQFTSILSGWTCPNITSRVKYTPESNPTQYFNDLVSLYDFNLSYDGKSVLWHVSLPDKSLVLNSELNVLKLSGEGNIDFCIRYDDAQTFDDDEIKFQDIPFKNVDRLYPIYQQVLKSFLPNSYYDVWQLFYRSITTESAKYVLNEIMYFPKDDREIYIAKSNVAIYIYIYGTKIKTD